jgi:cobalt/nickel transport system permease protein
MHIADGIVTIEAAVAAYAVSLGAVAIAGKKAESEDIPRMGLAAAALFSVSLIHFPVAGTSVHLGLFGLAGIILGFKAFPAVFTALLFQALIFQHGGLLSLGLNAFNMGAGAAAAVLVWKWSGLPEPLRAGAAGFLGVVIPAALMAIEFRLSGYGKGIIFILGIYAVVGIVEAALTIAAVGFFRKIKSPILEKT